VKVAAGHGCLVFGAPEEARAMAIRTSHEPANVERVIEQLTKSTPENADRRTAPRMTSERVWHSVAKASFAVLSHVTPAGEPRSSGVVYKAVGRRLYVAVAPDSWKAKHVPAKGRVAVTVPVRRGGLLSLVAPIPPATISFHGTAMVHPAGSPQAVSLLQEIGSLVPAERRASAAVIEIIPEGMFLTYGLGVPLRTMLDPAAARARVPVTPERVR
jgi:Pyridoxamine 5'-phosphate oxidase